MADPQRLPVEYLVLHHAVTGLWSHMSKADLAKWFSDNGFKRGYGSNPTNWNGLINPYTGQRSYSQAQLAGQVVTDETPDATPQERAAGYRLVPLVKDIFGVICYHAGNWEVNRAAIGIENLGDFRNYTLSDEACKVIADFWRGHDRNRNGDTQVVGHREVSQLGTECPARIMERRDFIIELVNQDPVAPPPPVNSSPLLEWRKYPEVKRVIAFRQPTSLWNFNKRVWTEIGNPIKNFDEGTVFDIAGEVENKSLNATYLLTPFSFENKITNGFNAVDVRPYTEPTPQPDPEPTPPPDYAEVIEAEVKRQLAIEVAKVQKHIDALKAKADDYDALLAILKRGLG